jgi:hypothetical protein
MSGHGERIANNLARCVPWERRVARVRRETAGEGRVNGQVTDLAV